MAQTTLNPQHAKTLEARDARAGFVSPTARRRGGPTNIRVDIRNKHTGNLICSAEGVDNEDALDRAMEQLAGLPKQSTVENLQSRIARLEREKRQAERENVDLEAKLAAQAGGEEGDDPPNEEEALMQRWLDTDDETLRAIYLEQTGSSSGNRVRKTMILQLADQGVFGPPGSASATDAGG